MAAAFLSRGNEEFLYDESHAGIHGYSSTDLTVAAELALAIHETVYPAVL